MQRFLDRNAGVKGRDAHESAPEESILEVRRGVGGCYPGRAFEIDTPGDRQVEVCVRLFGVNCDVL
jgi:hypothetical protein